MNCAEVDRILDSQGSDVLTPKHKRAVDEHLASCRECREAWAAYRGLMAEPLPATPRELRHRVMGALLAARQAKPRAARPVRLAVGIALLAGAAAASTWVYRVFEEERAVTSVVVDGDRAPTAARSPDTGAAAVPVATSPSTEFPNEGAAVPTVVPTTVSDHPLDAYSVVVIAMPSPGMSQQAAEYFEQCHEEALRELRTVDGLNVIAGAQVSPYSDSRRPPEEIGRELWAGSVLVLSTESATRLGQMPAPPAGLGLDSRVGSCYADLIDVQTSAGRPIAGVGGTWAADKPRRFAADVARTVRDAILDDRSALIRAQATVLDPAIDVGVRVTALGGLRRGRMYSERLDTDEVQGMAPEPIPGAFTEAVVAAAADIGAAWPDATVRSYAWRHLRGVRDPNLTQTLLYSLASDGDANVRCQAALTLGYLVDEPGVRSALMRASVEDPSTEPPVRGCSLSVRIAAQRALQSDDELRTASLRTVLDTTLPSAARLAPLHQSIDGRGLPTVLDQTTAEARCRTGTRGRSSSAQTPCRGDAGEGRSGASAGGSLSCRSPCCADRSWHRQH